MFQIRKNKYGEERLFYKDIEYPILPCFVLNWFLNNANHESIMELKIYLDKKYDDNKKGLIDFNQLTPLFDPDICAIYRKSGVLFSWCNNCPYENNDQDLKMIEVEW